VNENLRNVPAYAHALARRGEQNSRHAIATPALVCDLALLQENIERMALETRAAGVALRPHVKSHKSTFIVTRQIAAGASGISCAKIGEAEAIIRNLGDDDLDGPLSVLLTSPFVGHQSAQRVAALAAHCHVITVVDHVDGVDELERAACEANVVIEVLCDVDVGLHRTGVPGPDEAVEVARRIDNAPHLRFGGVQGYAGHLQHVVGREHRRAAVIAATQQLRDVIDAIEASGFDVTLRTGGGTGTSSLDIEVGVLNELQPGSYVFMDRQYRDALGDDREGRYHQSLTLLTTVISSNHDGFVTVDAGWKAMATDAGVPSVLGHDAATFAFFGDEHGRVTNGDGPAFQRGERLELLPPHCDTTIDRYEVIWLVHDDVVVDVIEVVARGRSQ
jgi:D-serine deaminase-like pyridoxal phosphate-dependent protein